jgi:putative SOS response-associated peptidase YedK
MCGRLTVHCTAADVARLVEEPLSEEVAEVLREPRYNVAPGSGLVVVHEDRDREGVRSASVLHWGLVPSWTKDPTKGSSLINARVETIASKPSFADAYRYRRCLVPVSGFYEWDRRARPAWPYYFRPAAADAPLLLLAGIWEYWLHPCGSEIYSLALVTTAADEVMAPIHHRMPLIVRGDACLRWLDHRVTMPDMGRLLAPRERASPLQCHPVGDAVNRAMAQGAQLIEPVQPPPRAAQMDLFAEP